MTAMKLTIDTENIDTVPFGSTEPHYRLIRANETGGAMVVNVQDFDYYDYNDRFIGKVCFEHEADAEKAAKKINKIGIKHFI